MFDFTHKKRPDLIQLVLLIAVVCLALGAITPAVSAIGYDDLSFSSSSGGGSLIQGTMAFVDHQNTYFYDTPPAGLNYRFWCLDLWKTWAGSSLNTVYYSDVGSVAMNTQPFSSVFPSVSGGPIDFCNWIYVIDPSTSSLAVLPDTVSAAASTAQWILDCTNISSSSPLYIIDYGDKLELVLYNSPPSFDYSYYSFIPGESLDISLQAFGSEDPSGMYVLSLDGSLLDTTYTVGINRYTSEFTYLIDSYAYTDGSGDYIFTGSRSLTLPIYYNSFTNMPYSYEVSINVNDENGYLDTRYPVYWSDLGGLYDSAPAPVLPTPIPTPTQTFIPTLPVNPSDIIPDPDDLNDTVNITGWYQDMGYEGNNITAPIYSGIRGWFNENLVPVIDFFLTPTNYVATVISNSAETSTDGISYITEELGSYAAPFNTVGAYVVRLVPEVVWLVVFAALSIGYVILLIKISTGSIRDTIGRFLGGSK